MLFSSLLFRYLRAETVCPEVLILCIFRLSGVFSHSFSHFEVVFHFSPQQLLFFYALGSRLRSQWKCCIRQLLQHVCLKTSNFKLRGKLPILMSHTDTHTFFYIIDPMWVCSAGAAARFRTGGINRADFCFLQDSHICLFRSTVSVSVAILSCSCLCSELGRAHLPHQVTAVDAEDTFSPKLVQMM